MQSKKNYGKTIFLPQVGDEFPMRGNLPALEEKILKYWDEVDIYKLIQKNKSKKPFIFHHGPPFSNGNFHLGHFCTITLKDFVVRYKLLCGYPVPIVQGHDCHGLPIELKVQEKLRNSHVQDYSISGFMQECRKYANEWCAIHKQQTKRLGVVTQNKFYCTMDKETEYKTYEIFSDLILANKVYMAKKPMFWSIKEQSTVAEIEVVYKNHTSNSLYVKLPIVGNCPKEMENSSIIIWTTTPWTLISNLAVAYGKDYEYTALNLNGEKVYLATELVGSFMQKAEEIQQNIDIQGDKILGNKFDGCFVAHPMIEEKSVPLIHSDHVSQEDGTGFVHIAPDHGEEDFALGLKYHLGLCDYVDEAGYYKEDIPVFPLAGKHIFKDESLILTFLQENERLVIKEPIEHSYPYSDRTNSPLIYRCTEQIFIKTNDIKEQLINNINEVNWIPSAGKNRITSFINNRKTDWCVSRQRLWGIPLLVYVHKTTGEVLSDKETQKVILEELKKRGIDTIMEIDWTLFLREELLDYRPVYGILDVWFDSGSTWKTVLSEAVAELLGNKDHIKEWEQADLYLEGSDQHRGWFQSSLILSTLLNGKAPYKNVMTHGFAVDQNGMKMSKSKGNGVTFEQLLSNGLDVARILLVTSDYYEDIKIGEALFESKKEIYRKIRNILRYLIGATKQMTKEEYNYEINDSNPLEQYILHKAYLLEKYVYEQAEAMNIKPIFDEVFKFIQDLSNFYLDIKKDILYCDLQHSHNRMATRKTQWMLLDLLLRLLSPIIPFTVEEVGLALGEVTYLDRTIGECIPLHTSYIRNYDLVVSMREFITPIKIALEQARNDKIINTNNEAVVFAPITNEIANHLDLLKEILMVSEINWKETILIQSSVNGKCLRCWKYNLTNKNEEICARCTDYMCNVVPNSIE